MNILKHIVYGPFQSENFGDLYLPEHLFPETPLALTIHGGGWNNLTLSSFAGVAEFLCKNGYAVFNIEYRLTGTAPWPACGDDCLKAAAFLSEPDSIPALAKIRDRRIIAVGGSAGGHLALMTGLRMQNCRAMVSISGVNAPEGYLKCNPNAYKTLFGHEAPFSEKEIREAFPIEYLLKNEAPILLTHAIFDTVVDIHSSVIFEDAARKTAHPVRTYYYNRRNDGHCIWLPNSSPHRLHPDIEREILRFLHDADHSAL